MLTERSLNVMRQYIYNETYLLSDSISKVNSLPKDIYEYINCYAYALGLIRPSKNRIYIPGFTTNLLYDENSKEDLISNICKDLNNLSIKYTKYGVFDKIKLKKSEYLVQVLYIPTESFFWPKSDFHFLRKSKNGKWFSKPGWLNQPSFSYVEPILKFKDEEIVRVHFEGFSRVYIRVGYFAIKEK